MNHLGVMDNTPGPTPDPDQEARLRSHRLFPCFFRLICRPRMARMLIAIAKEAITTAATLEGVPPLKAMDAIPSIRPATAQTMPTINHIRQCLSSCSESPFCTRHMAYPSTSATSITSVRFVSASWPSSSYRNQADPSTCGRRSRIRRAGRSSCRTRSTAFFSLLSWPIGFSSLFLNSLHPCRSHHLHHRGLCRHLVLAPAGAGRPDSPAAV